MADPDDSSHSPSGRPSAEEAPTVAIGPRHQGTPARIGHYTVRRVIASGGMGTVLEALQDEPRRSVAIKIMKGGLDSAEALRRFHFEAQLLARLRHPGIAQIYEAGTHDDGSGPTPFFAMEYIPNAKPITEYAARRHLDLRDKLALFARVCEAVHHGHQRGVIHRDIKPSNILVDSDGNPKVIDFGVARATDSESALSVFQTQVGQIIGSIAYMSPEQFEADPRDVDTRSDVYALGVVLYELIGGRLPYEVSTAKIYDAARIIREQQPVRLQTLVPGLPIEVETVVRRALEKDRERRYQSANGLAEDLRRFLAGQTVVASPPSAVYQLRVFARRHKVLLAGMATVFAVLVGAVIATSTMYVRAERERRRAEHESARTQAAIDFLTESLASISPENFNHEPTLADLMHSLDARIDGAFPNDPLLEAELRKTIGWAYGSQKGWDATRRHLSRAYDLRVKAGAEDNPKTLEVLDKLGTACEIGGRHDDLIAARRHAVDVCRRLYGERGQETILASFQLADALGDASHLKEAQEVASPTAVLAAEVFGVDQVQSLRCQAQLAWLQLAQGRAAESEAVSRALLETCLRTVGEQHDLTRLIRSELAGAMIVQGKVTDAEALYGDRTLPPDLGIEHRYQGDPTIGGDVQLLVFWETWCPFSQRTVPSLEKQHLNYSNLDVVGLTRARPPSDDRQVAEFVAEKGLTFPIARTNHVPWAYFDIPGTPYIVVAKDKHIIWENTMSTPSALLDQLLAGVARGEQR